MDRRLRALTLVAATAALAACGSSKPTAAHSQTRRPTPSPTPSDTVAATPLASLPPSAMDVFKAAYDKVDSGAWTQASLGLKDANTPQQVLTVLNAEMAALVAYHKAMAALPSPPDDVTTPISPLLTDDLTAIDSLESAVRQLQTDARAENESAYNRDGEGPYKTAYDGLTKADNLLAFAVQADSQG